MRPVDNILPEGKLETAQGKGGKLSPLLWWHVTSGEKTERERERKEEKEQNPDILDFDLHSLERNLLHIKKVSFRREFTREMWKP